MIFLRHLYNGSVPPFELLKPYRLEDFEELDATLHNSVEESTGRFWVQFSLQSRDDLGDLR